jgi:hypothetical protein
MECPRTKCTNRIENPIWTQQMNGNQFCNTKVQNS